MTNEEEDLAGDGDMEDQFWSWHEVRQGVCDHDTPCGCYDEGHAAGWRSQRDRHRHQGSN